MAEYDDALLAKAAEALYANVCEPTGTKARAVLDAVAPLIAAQALREAADAIRDHGCGGGDLSCHRSDMLLLAIRADELAPAPRQQFATGATANSQPESGPEGHRELRGPEIADHVVAREGEA